MQMENKVCKYITMSKIQPANRVNSVAEYYFSAKLKEIAQMNVEGKNVINLGVGSPDLPPSEATLDVMCKQTRHVDMHGYQPYTGIPELRSAFAAWYKRWYSVELNPDTEIQPLIGSKEGILHVSLAFLNPGDGVLIPNPGYPTYRSLSTLLGAEPHDYNLTESNQWYPDFDALEQMDLSRIKMMWVNYPHMPTGAPATLELFERLVAFGKKHEIVICNDNPYSFILNNNPLSILQVDGAKDNCIELNSMSKSHNMPGWRIGLAASNAQFIKWILKVKSNIDSGMFRPLQLAAVAALQNSTAWHETMNTVYARRRTLAEKIMQALACTYDAKQSGLFLWGKAPSRCPNSKTFSDNLLYDMNVFITPGFIFGTNGEGFLRISLCCSEQKLEEALRRIKK
ncbi:MAG: aminotransferase class I/II-fold pyridoxal phosphate-dependent enzyme [Bacteroidales bacterium]|jgi:aspartate/methionine/tyrosine aminotransferase|nr:aminotransferase class I/II-fold pyridoxal phosphate-dependent enzyme [Bacteroidales bacterium]